MRRPPNVLAAVLAGAAAMLVATAVTFGWPATAQTSPPTADETVKLQGNAYNPQSVALDQAGKTVYWHHEDGATPHTVTFVGGEGYDTGQDRWPDCTPSDNQPGGEPRDCFQQGDADFIVTFETAGLFKYTCKIHPTMTGEVRVGGTVVTAAPKTTTTKAGGAATPTTTQVSPSSTIGTLDTTSTIADRTGTTFVTPTSVVGASTSTTSGDLAVGASNDDDDDKPSFAIQAVAVLLLAAAIAALIPSWRRLT